MKKLLFSIAIAACICPAAYAQTTYTPTTTGGQTEHPGTVRHRTTAPANNNGHSTVQPVNNGIPQQQRTATDPSGASSYQNHTNEGTNGYRSPNGTMNGNNTSPTNQNNTGTSNPSNNATLHQDYNNTVNPGSGGSTEHR